MTSKVCRWHCKAVGGQRSVSINAYLSGVDDHDVLQVFPIRLEKGPGGILSRLPLIHSVHGTGVLPHLFCAFDLHFAESELILDEEIDSVARCCDISA
jgi:hypothetical protein